MSLLPVLLALFAAVPMPQIAAASGPSSTPTQAIDRDLAGLLVRYSIASVSFAQIEDGRIALVRAFGWQSAGVPATTDSLYNIASLTKPLTAEVVLRLVSKGDFSLDEPMFPYWVDPDVANDERSKQLTPRIALSHQTGFPNWRDRGTGLKFERDPGTKYGYSGEGYNYLARFVEKRTNQRFEDLAQSVLFDPALMKDTAYTGKPWFEGRVAIPTDASGSPLSPHIPAHYSAADAVYTTARDYATFMLEVLADSGLRSAVARERQRAQVSMMDAKCLGPKAAACPPYTGLGLGWQMLYFEGETLMMHTGNDEGVVTFAYLDRTAREGAVILTNSDNGGKIVVPILERLRTSAAFLRYVKSQME